MNDVKKIGFLEWIELLQSRGLWAFSLELAKKELPNLSEIAIKSAISRLAKKSKLISIHKGYYLILPPQYSRKGILPPTLFVDSFFKFLKRPYYVSLLNAAAFHGASHQQPQEFFITTVFPVMRPTKKKNLKINYLSIDAIPEKLMETRKTEAGYINISNVVLTACDLVQYEKRIGGINRAATVLSELSENIKPSDFDIEILKHVPVTTLQRLGYIFEHVCFNMLLADNLFNAMLSSELKLFRIPLKASGIKKGYTADNRWKIIVNTAIETDF